MEYLWVFPAAAGVAFLLEAFLEDYRYRAEVDIESRKYYYPLEFETATKFHVVESVDDAGVSNQNIINVTDGNNFIIFKIVKKEASFLSEKWSVVRSSSEFELATIVIGGWFKKSYIYFSRSNVLNSSQIASAASNNDINSGGPLSSPLASPYSSRFLPSSPYIDASISFNRVKKSDLGPSVFLPNSSLLNNFELRKLFKIVVAEYRSSSISKFKISKGCMNYTWRFNGYLEKTPKNKLDNSCERIAVVKLKDLKKVNFTVYMNEDKIEKLVVITTAFLNLKKSMWNSPKLVNKAV